MDTNVINKQKNIDLLDLVKFILSFVIVAVHSQLFDPYLYPWLRLAVPLFFIISSYLFFTKINGLSERKQRLLALKSFVLRNLMLYAFWFVVTFPINIFLRGWFDNGFFKGILNVLQNVVLGSTFVASWFITALIIGVTVIFFASEKLSNKTLIIIGAVLYVLISIRSSYMFIFADLTDLLIGILNYESVMNAPMNSFPAGIFWIVCGKMFADGEFKHFKLKTSVIILAVSSALLFTEWLMLKIFVGSYNKDFYLLLAPCALAVFNILLQLKPIRLKYAREMRKISVIVFATHGTFISCLGYVLRHTIGPVPSVVTFLVTSVVCTGGAILILYLEKYKYLKWLKYSH